MSKKPKRIIQVMLDSGVFSSWNLKKPIELGKYIEFVKRNEPWLNCYVNFDVIPGEFGKKRTTDQIKASAEGSWNNFQTMLDAGLTPMPVFHQGEDFKWFERMLKEGHHYIGISTAKDMRPADGMRWLNDVFSIICDKQGRPLIKTHGFGITKPKWLINYPFYTVDSTTWALSAGYGIAYIPIKKMGNTLEPDLLRAPERFIVSGVQQKGWQKLGSTLEQEERRRRAANSRQVEKHAGYMGEDSLIFRYITNYLENICGVPHAMSRNDPDARRKINLTYYRLLQETLQDVRFKQIGSMSDIHSLREALKGIKAKKQGLHITYATNMQTTFTKLLLEMGMTRQLISYFEFVHNYKSEDQLRQYVETGLVPVKKRARQKMDSSAQSYINMRSVALYNRLQEPDNADSEQV